MKKILLLVFTVAFLSSCNDTKKSNSTDIDSLSVEDSINSEMNETEMSETETVDHHNSKISLDWDGTYTGTLPCDDCEGIETELTIGSDVYVLKTLQKGVDDAYLEQTGNFTWTNDGSTIVLGDIDEGFNQYKVEENRVVLLDESGNKYTGDQVNEYRLNKQ